MVEGWGLLLLVALLVLLLWRANRTRAPVSFADLLAALGRSCDRAVAMIGEDMGDLRESFDSSRAPDRVLRFTEREAVEMPAHMFHVSDEEKLAWMIGTSDFERLEVTEEPAGGMTVRVWDTRGVE